MSNRSTGPWRQQQPYAMDQAPGGIPMFSQGQDTSSQDPVMYSQGGGMSPPPGFNFGGAPTPGGGGGPMTLTDAALLGNLNKLSGERSDVERQRKLADMLRTSAAGQLQGTQAGRIYKAPNAWNMAANLAGTLAGAYRDDQANLQAKDISNREAQGAQRTLGLLRPDLAGVGAGGAGSPLPGAPGGQQGPLSPDWSGQQPGAAPGQQAFLPWLKQGFSSWFGGGGS